MSCGDGWKCRRKAGLCTNELPAPASSPPAQYPSSRRPPWVDCTRMTQEGHARRRHLTWGPQAYGKHSVGLSEAVTTKRAVCPLNCLSHQSPSRS